MNARSLSSVTVGDLPVSGTPRQKFEFAVKYAALAPTESNWQPWYFRVADTYLELMTKKNPAREAADPELRGFMIGCGSALLYLKLALRRIGCLGRVALFPDLEQPALVARIHLGFCGERDAQEKLLFEAMPGSSPGVSPLGESPITETMLAALGHGAAGECAWLDFVQSEMSWQHVLKTTLSNGQGWENFISRARLSIGFGGRNIHLWDGAIAPIQQPAVSTATLAVVKTKTDDKRGWLEAGQMLARTVLQAQALGIPWAFFDPVRRREAREALRIGVGHKGFAQVILRFGGHNIHKWDGTVASVRHSAVSMVRSALSSQTG
ncbi:MAG TPA: hypothetical protein VME24_01875 [Alphaproteobacteria bacterium]|nr:hypothetical protein [Alphaproteobacteria bacterium]